MKKVYLFLVFLLVHIGASYSQCCVTYSISGPTGLCPSTSATYTVVSSPSGTLPFAYYNWSTSSDITITSGQGTSTINVTFNHTTCGTGTINVQVGSSSTNYVTLSYAPAENAPPNLNGIDFSIVPDPNITYDPLCIDALTDLQMVQNSGCAAATYYVWTYTEVGSSSPPTSFSPSSSTRYQPIWFDHEATFQVSCTPGNDCGLGQPAYFNINVVDCGGFKAFPNPAGNAITITSTPKSTSTLTLTKKTAFSYKIYDELGKLLKSGTSDGADVNVKTDDLQSKVYFLHVTINGMVYKKQIIVKH